MTEWTLIGKIVRADFGIVENGYKNALHFSITVDYEDIGSQGFGRDYITTTPVRKILEMFKVDHIKNLVGRYAYIIREGKYEFDAMIIGFRPMKGDGGSSETFMAKDWYDFEKSAYDSLEKQLKALG